MGAGCCRGASYKPELEATPDAAKSFSSTAAPPSPSAEAAREGAIPEADSAQGTAAPGAKAHKERSAAGAARPKGGAAGGGVRHAWGRPGGPAPPVPPVPGPGSTAARDSPRDAGTAENSAQPTPRRGVDGCDALHLQDVQTPQSLETAKESFLKLDAEAPKSVPRNGSSHGPRRTPRTFSLPSLQAMQTLEDIDGRLRHIEARVCELDGILRGPPESFPENVGKIKTELAFLESEANRLESAGVDNVYTSELNSGKAPAKEAKREQLARLEALFSTIDELFKVMQSKA